MFFSGKSVVKRLPSLNRQCEDNKMLVKLPLRSDNIIMLLHCNIFVMNREH